MDAAAVAPLPDVVGIFALKEEQRMPLFIGGKDDLVLFLTGFYKSFAKDNWFNRLWQKTNLTGCFE